jgi:rhamnosyltransferase
VILLKALIRSLSGQVEYIFLYRNSSIERLLVDVIDCHQHQLIILGDEHNLGIGAAHNEIMKAALARGIERVLLFDQDTSPSSGLAEELLSRMESLIRGGTRPAVVGPRPIAADGRPYKIPRPLAVTNAPRGNIIPVESVISSGSLINGAAFREVGPFRDDFFIDAVDIEWCLRARSKGFTCWMATDVLLCHRLGQGIIRLPVIGMHLVRQPPERAYTFVRNSLVMFRLGHVSPSWKARAAARLLAYTVGQIIYSPRRRSAVRALVHAWWDGLRGHLGSPRTDRLGSD